LASVGFGTFSIYVDDESSLGGGILASLPYLPWIFLVLNVYNKYSKDEVRLKEDSFNILYSLSIYPFLFLFLGLFTQIIFQRYIEPFILVWVVFIFYSLRYEDSVNDKILVVLKILGVFIISFYLKYILPLSLLGFSEWLIHFYQILDSNRFDIFNFDDFNF
jgi:hypothetical protein